MKGLFPEKQIFTNQIFLKNIDCKNFDEYKHHLESIAKLIDNWGVAKTCDVPADIIPNLIIYHGIDTLEVPSYLKKDVTFFETYKMLRELTRLHDEIISYDLRDNKINKMQKIMIEADNKCQLVLLIFLADSMSRLLDARDGKCHSKRIKAIASLYLELYESKVVEKGIINDAKRASDKAMLIINEKTYNALNKRVEYYNHYGDLLTNNLNALFANLSDISIVFEFYTRHISSIAKDLGVLYFPEENIVEISHLNDIGRVVCLLENIDGIYRVMKELFEKFPSSERKIKDFISYPKVSGYKGLHVRLPLWLDYERKNNILSDLSNPQSLQEFIPFALLLPESAPFLKGNDRVRIIENQLISSTKKIIVYTKDNDPVELPENSSILDFAFALHSEIGIHCLEAKVCSENLDNGIWKNKKPEYILTDNEKCEIVIDNAVEPNPKWLKVCKTKSARNTINKYIRAKRAVQKYSYRVFVKIFAIDMKGLTKIIAKELSDRDIYASYFKGKATGDGFAKFEFELLLSANERESFILRKRLEYAFMNIAESPILSVNVSESEINNTGKLINWNRDKKDWVSSLEGITFFSGRKKAVLKLETWLNFLDTPYTAVTGFYRAGKTVLSAFFTEKLKGTERVYINVNNVRHVNSENEFWGEICRIIEAYINNNFSRICRKYKVERSNKERFLNVSMILIQYLSNIERKRLLIIFDDIDVIDDLAFGPMINNLIAEVKILNDTINFEKGHQYRPKFMFIGQYKLYRFLKSIDNSTIHHIPIKYHIDQNSCIKFIEKRLFDFCKNNPNMKFLTNYITKIVDWVGTSPALLTYFIDMLLSKVISFDENLIKTLNENFVEDLLKPLFEEIIEDGNISAELFKHMKIHYLENPENQITRKIFNIMTQPGNKGITKKILIAKLNQGGNVERIINELIDFGFVYPIEDSKSGTWINLKNDILSNYLCSYFERPLLRK